MRTILKLGAVASFLSVLAFAESWNGALLDANCTEQQKSACSATGSTTAFLLAAGDKVYKLDDAGNAKAVEALKNRADRTKEPTKDPIGSDKAVTVVAARVSGTLEGEILKVETIQVQ
jgi:hypothetical protein